MFKFLKDKLKQTVSKITQRFEAVAEDGAIAEETVEASKDNIISEEPVSSGSLDDSRPESAVSQSGEVKTGLNDAEVSPTSEKPKQSDNQQSGIEQSGIAAQKVQAHLPRKPKPAESEPSEVIRKKHKYSAEEKQLDVISEPDVINEIKEIDPEEVSRENIEVESKDLDRAFSEEYEEKAVEEDEIDELTHARQEIEKEESRGFFSRIKNKIIGRKTILDEALSDKPSYTKPDTKEDISLEAVEQEDPFPESKEHFNADSSAYKEQYSTEKIKPEQAIEEEASGFIGRIKQKIATKRLTDAYFEELFWELEVALLENNVAVEVIDKIKADLKLAIVDKPIARSKINTTIMSSLRDSVSSLFDLPKVDLLARMSAKKPFIICFFGINGSGKTTTIAKIAKYLQDSKKSCVLAAADTFRAAAIDQLQQHATNLNIKMIKHDYGSDPAAVAFDAVAYAKAHNIDAVLIDTAGRMHSNTNLVEEMKKIVRVSNPDLKIFVGEAIVGNDAVEQCKQFNDAISIDCIILSKADVDEKGGAAISISYVTKKPILYLGVGQEYSDLEPFDAAKVLQSVGLEA